MYEKEFNAFGAIIQDNDFMNTCLNDSDYLDYADTIVEYNGSEEQIQEVLANYNNELKHMLLSNPDFLDKIMTEGGDIIHHDLDVADTIDLDKVISQAFDNNPNLNQYERRAKNFLILECANLVNIYGSEALENNKERVAQEMRLGVYPKIYSEYIDDEKKEKLVQRIELDNTFGEQAIPYIENYQLLKTRVSTLLEAANTHEETENIQNILTKLNLIDQQLSDKNKDVLPLLQDVYNSYELANKTMLIARLNKDGSEVINNPSDDRLMLVHFVPQHNNSYDQTQNEHFEKTMQEFISETIDSKYGRPFDESLDADEAQELRDKYAYSREHPCDLKSRIPLKCRYTKHIGRNVITKPTTSLSCSITSAGAMKPHLDRKIALGFSSIPLEAIKSIHKGYNNALDEFNFEKDSVPFTEALDGISKGRTNETLVDWSQVSPSYIMIVKDSEEIDQETLATAQRYADELGLPLKIYDDYEIEKARHSQSIDSNTPIEGTVSTEDLAEFAMAPVEPSLMDKVKQFFKDHFKKRGGPENEQFI